MAHTVVIGAGPVGLVTAMLLAADGHRVTVLDRDSVELRDRKRPGVRQFGQPHILLPGGMRLLESELPAVVEELRAVGGRPYNTISGTWGIGRVGPERPGDDRFETLPMRRLLLETALLTAARRTDGVTLRQARVTGLLSGERRAPGSPHVTGVVTDDGTELAADLVVDATGRDSRVPALLAALGAESVEREGSPGFRYYSRFFRSPHGTLPTPRRWLLTHHDSVSLITLPTEWGTWSVTFVTSGRDQELRALSDGGAWDRAAALYPELAGWLTGEASTGVTVMGGTATRRRGLQLDGRPLATGLVPVGDAWATTNPQFGMGMTLGFRQAVLLRDQLRKTDTDGPAELLLAYDRTTRETLVPLWDDTDAWDRHRLAEIDAEIQGRRYTTDDEMWQLRNTLDAVRLADPRLLRAVADVAGLLLTPDEALVRSGLLPRVAELGAGVPRYTEPGPDRAELLSAVGAAGEE